MLPKPSFASAEVHGQSLNITVGTQEDSFQSGMAVVCADNVAIDSLVSVLRCQAAPITGRYVTIQAKGKYEEPFVETVLSLCDVQIYAQGKQFITFMQ